jgi:hypothetical protein
VADHNKRHSRHYNMDLAYNLGMVNNTNEETFLAHLTSCWILICVVSITVMGSERCVGAILITERLKAPA